MPSTASVDPVLVEVVRNELEALVEEMRIAVHKTGRSPMVKVGDFAVTLCDGRGRGIGVGPSTFVTTQFFEMVQRVREHTGGEFAEGDVFIVNDPYSGGGHLPDLIFVQPIFWRGQVVAYAVCYSHHTDVGGRFPGSQSGQGTSLFEEGLRIPIVRVVAAGQRADDLLSLVLANVRTPVDYLGDIDAKIAGCWRAGRGLCDILDKYGLEVFEACSDHLNHVSAQTARKALLDIPPGEYVGTALVHDNGLGPIDEPMVVRATLSRQGDQLRVDFTGSSGMAAGAINMPWSNTCGVVYNALRELLAPSAPMNSGFMSVFDVVAPEGTIVRPTYPAPVAGRSTVFFVVDEAVHRALAQAIPDRVPVPREAWDVMHFSGQRPDGSSFAVMDLFCGGWGARPRRDGPDGIAPAPTITLPVELFEREYPLVVESFGLVPDTAGAGQFRGSLAVERRYRYLQGGTVMIRTNRLVSSQGMHGGGGGAQSFTTLVRDGVDVPVPRQAYVHLKVEAGDVLTHRVGGSGGYGEPALRDPAAIARDVEEGFYSRATATEVFGAALERA